MKIILSLAVLLAVSGCKHNDSKPQDPVVIVKPPVVPTPPPVAKEVEFCQAAGKAFHCGTNEWWKMECGGNIVAEQVYFISVPQLQLKADEKIGQSSCVEVLFLDSHKEAVHFGFGPCLPCEQLGSGIMAKSVNTEYKKMVDVYQKHLDSLKK